MVPKSPRTSGSGSSNRSIPSDYPRLFDAQRWEPPGATQAEQAAALDALARSMYPATQMQSRGLDRRLANPDLPAGYTYFGQFVVHDMTRHHFEKAQVGGVPTTTALLDLRRRKLALEVLFGSGPLRSPELYVRADPARLRVEEHASVDGKPYHDLARDASGRAVVEDWRQDENVMISQMHVAFARAYGALLDGVRKRHPEASVLDAHDRARTALVHAYQWVVLRDFAPRVLDSARARWLELALDGLATGSAPAFRLFASRAPFLSAEAAFAAFRFGHALVREAYRPRSESYLFELAPPTTETGWLAKGGAFITLFRPLPAGFAVDWRAFLPNPDGIEHQHARRIGPRLAWSLGNLPREVGQPESAARLAYLTLNAGWAQPVALVPGADAARALALQTAASAEEPFWRYVLVEAEKETQGRTLGALGSTIVAETLLGLLVDRADAYLARDPKWTPPFGADGKPFTLFDLLTLGDRPAKWVAERLD